MDSVFIGAQIVGFIAMCIGIAAMQIKNPRYILTANIPACLLWALQYVMLGAPAGAIINLGFALKDSILYFISERYVPYLIITFMALIWGHGLYSIQYWYDLLPLLSASAVNMALLTDRDNRPLFTRSVIIACLLWVVYNVIVASWMGAICASLTVISSVISMYRYEEWEIGTCYKSFLPSLARSLSISSTPQTYP